MLALFYLDIVSTNSKWRIHYYFCFNNLPFEEIFHQLKMSLDVKLNKRKN